LTERGKIGQQPFALLSQPSRLEGGPQNVSGP
jgi:hypothetical protein